MLVIALVAAAALYRGLNRVARVGEAVYRMYAVVALVSIAVGAGCAFLFQAVYDFAETGRFELRGMTFLGGLVGGALAFVCGGLIADRRELVRQAELALPCVTVAHALGRIGCFLAGCCYGRESDFGLYFPALGKKVIPTQLYEAIFLFALTALLLIIVIKSARRASLRGAALPVYLYAYSLFRFTIEFFRDDPRGAFLGPLSPSQVICIIMFAAALALITLRILRPNVFIDNAQNDENTQP